LTDLGVMKEEGCCGDRSRRKRAVVGIKVVDEEEAKKKLRKEEGCPGDRSRRMVAVVSIKVDGRLGRSFERKDGY